MDRKPWRPGPCMHPAGVIACIVIDFFASFALAIFRMSRR